MIAITDFIPFLIATIVLNLTPGSDVLLVASQSISQGVKGGILAALGVSVGILFHISAASLGLVKLLSIYPLALTLIKIIGATYLLYLAYISLKTEEINWTKSNKSEAILNKIFIRGILTNILNPKVALFFLAFLPQFIKPENGSLFRQTLQLGGAFIISGTIINIGYALIFAYARHYIQGSKRFAKYLNRISASIFGILATKMMITD